MILTGKNVVLGVKNFKAYVVVERIFMGDWWNDTNKGN